MMAIASWLHLFEEFVYPGGFLRWIRICFPSAKLTVADAVVINALFVGFVATPLVSDVRGAPIVAISIPAILIINAFLHAGGTIATRRYSPGVVTAVLLYWPIGAYAVFSMASNWNLSGTTVAKGLLLGVCWHSIPFLRAFVFRGFEGGTNSARG
jgi:Protein of unknown function with HXXEE motif